jgi:hypothetical protein
MKECDPMRRLNTCILATAFVFCLLSPSVHAAQTSDPTNFSGDWVRTTPIVSYGNVPAGGPNEDPAAADPVFTDEGSVMYDANKPGYGPRRGMERNDPLSRCEPVGIPRNVNAEIVDPHSTFEIVQAPARIFQFFEYRHDWREIWMDGREFPSIDELGPRWQGYSIGRIEGDTLVVETIGVDSRTWLDKFGYPHSEEMRLEERYRLLDADTLELTMTVIDPVVYAEPFESDRKLFRLDQDKTDDWDEQVYCVPEEEFAFQQLIGSGNVID